MQILYGNKSYLQNDNKCHLRVAYAHKILVTSVTADKLLSCAYGVDGT